MFVAVKIFISMVLEGSFGASVLIVSSRDHLHFNCPDAFPIKPAKSLVISAPEDKVVVN